MCCPLPLLTGPKRLNGTWDVGDKRRREGKMAPTPNKTHRRTPPPSHTTHMAFFCSDLNRGFSVCYPLFFPLGHGKLSEGSRTERSCQHPKLSEVLMPSDFFQVRTFVCGGVDISAGRASGLSMLSYPSTRTIRANYLEHPLGRSTF